MAEAPRLNDLTRLGRKLRQRRDELRLSRAEVGLGVGISESYVGHIERGLRCPEPDVLQGLARVLGLDYDHELAPLAGYVQSHPQLTEQETWLARLRRFPPEVLERLDKIGDLVFYEDVPEPPTSPKPGEGTEQQQGEDEPDSEATGAG